MTSPEDFANLWITMSNALLDARAKHGCPEPVTDTIYHYTSMPILEALGPIGAPVSKWTKWRATALAYMNDRSELLHGLEKISSSIRNYLPAATNATVRSGLVAIIAALEATKSSAASREVFCACFSANGDQLGQWRGYADNGSGICLGFDYATLKSPGFLNGFIIWVLYDEKAQQTVSDAIAIEVEAFLASENVKGNYLNDSDAILKVIVAFLIALAASFKHEGFSEEAECRWLYFYPFSQRRVETKFRAVGGRLIPYVELDCYNGVTLPLRSLRFGPKSSSPNNLLSAELFCQGYTFKGNPVHLLESGTPYL